MKYHLVVHTTDQVNRYFSRFTVGALVSAAWDNSLHGIPMLISHDSLRLVGWSHPSIVHFEPGLTRLVGINGIPETESESEDLFLAANNRIKRELMVNHQQDIEELDSLLVAHLNGDEIAYPAECVALLGKGLATRVFPTLFALTIAAKKGTKIRETLVPLSSLEPIGPGVFKVGQLALFAHPYFRRSLFRLNTLNVPFLEQLQQVQKDACDKADVLIALDPDMVGLASTYNQRMELQYWRGPKFNEDLKSISTGVTWHEASDEERFYFGISRTELWWQSRNGMHIFEAEEVRDLPGPPIDSLDGASYACRYVHCIVREDDGEIEHFDGSIRAYDEERMVQRLDSNIAEFGRNAVYTKLWKVDAKKGIKGVLPVAKWKRLLADYFRDNNQVSEYLGALPETKVDTASDEPEITRDEASPSSAVEKYVPYTASRGDGIRLAWSCRYYNQGSHQLRTVVPLDSLTTPGGTISIIESDVTELAKILAAEGTTLPIPDGTALMYCRDYYVNLPYIFHAAEGLPDSLAQTVNALRKLVYAWKHNGYDMVVAFTVGFPVEDREVRVSVLGHIDDLAVWLDHPLSIPPTEKTQFVSWAEEVSDFINQYPQALDKPKLADTLMPSGVLLISRSLLDPSTYKFHYSSQQTSPDIEVRVPAKEEALVAALHAGLLMPALVCRLLESKCSRCQHDYFACGCSKLIERDVIQEIVEADYAHVFWTDRPVA